MFVLFGDFYQPITNLNQVLNQNDVVSGDIFSEICDGHMLELTRNYRAENDVDFKEFITDLRIKKTEVNQILKHMVLQSPVSHYAGLIKTENVLITNGCKKNQGGFIHSGSP